MAGILGGGEGLPLHARPPLLIVNYFVRIFFNTRPTLTLKCLDKMAGVS